MGNGERMVAIRDIHGKCQLLRVERDFLTEAAGKNYVTVGIVHRDPKTETVLIELPHEAESGAHRLWVRPEHLRESLETPAA